MILWLIKIFKTDLADLSAYMLISSLQYLNMAPANVYPDQTSDSLVWSEFTFAGAMFKYCNEEMSM